MLEVQREGLRQQLLKVRDLSDERHGCWRFRRIVAQRQVRLAVDRDDAGGLAEAEPQLSHDRVLVASYSSLSRESPLIRYSRYWLVSAFETLR